MDVLKGFIAKLFPFTGRGWVFLILSGFLLMLGLARSELAALLWGAGFLLLAVYAALGTVVSRFILARREGSGGDELRVGIEPARVTEGGSAVLRLRAPLPRYRLPGIRLYARVALEWNARIRETEALIEPRQEAVEIPVDTRRRGTYAVRAVSLVARDLPGLCTASVPVEAAATITVLPEPADAAVSATAAGAGGEHRIESAVRRRSEELFETRRYVPGDDPRKINWKLFARWNELLVRIGEEVPPPRSRVLCYLYTGASPATGGRRAAAAALERERALDEAVSIFAGICHHLSRRGVEVAYGFGGTLRRGTVGSTDDRELLVELAGADWDAEVLPGAASGERSRLPIVLVAPRAAEGVEKVVARLRQHGEVAATITPQATDAGAAPGTPWWHHIIFARPVIGVAGSGV